MLLKKLPLKAVAVFLLVIIFAFSFIACGDKTDTTGTNGSDENTSGSDDSGNVKEEATPVPELTMDLKGRKIRVAAWWDPTPGARGGSESHDRYLDQLEANMAKNNYSYEYMNVPWDDFVPSINTSVLSGEPFADFCAAQRSWFYPGMVVKGFFEPLSDYDFIDFSNDKWNKFTAEAFSYKDKCYGADTGKILWPRDLMMWNTSLFAKYDQPDLYQLQKNMQWTWDKMLEIAKSLTMDLDKDGTKDYFGIGGEIQYQMIYSNNAQTIKFDQDGKPVFDMTSENCLEALSFYQDLFQKHGVYDVAPDGAAWDYYHTRFQDGFNGMIGSEYYKVSTFKTSMQDDYGLVLFPMGPKASDYTHHVMDLNIQLVLANNQKPEELAFVYQIQTEPVPGNDPEEWRTSYEGSLRDEGSIDTVSLCGEKAVINNIGSFQAIVQMGWTFFWEINSGSKTPAACMDEVQPRAQQVLDDTYAELTK